MICISDSFPRAREGSLARVQTRSAKRKLVAEGIIDRAEGLKRLSEIDLEATGASRFATPQPAAAKGKAASPGVASGRVRFTTQEASRVAERAKPLSSRAAIPRPGTSQASPPPAALLNRSCYFVAFLQASSAPFLRPVH